MRSFTSFSRKASTRGVKVARVGPFGLSGAGMSLEGVEASPDIL